MTGAELYEKAKNNGRGFLAFDRLPGVQKGLWNNAAREASFEKDRAFARGGMNERGLVIAFFRAKADELTKGMDPTLHKYIYVLAGGMIDAARMLERGEHT